MTMQNEACGTIEKPKLLIWQAMESRLAVYLASFSGLSVEDREDVLQSTLIAFWRKGPSAEAEARPWLYRVVRNASIDTLRVIKRSSSRQGQLEASDFRGTREPEDPSLGPEDSVLSHEEVSLVRKFLAALADRERELAFLAFCEDMTYEQIASLTGTSLGTVKWRLAGVKKRLAEHYRREMA